MLRPRRTTLRRRLRAYLPNTSERLALVTLDDRRPFRALWPVRLTQLIGSRRWSLSIATFRTPRPIETGSDTARAFLCLCNDGVQGCSRHPGHLLTMDERRAFERAWDARVVPTPGTGGIRHAMHGDTSASNTRRRR